MEPSYQEFENKIFRTNHKSFHKSHNVNQCNRFWFRDDNTVSFDDLILQQKVPTFSISKIILYFNTNVVLGFRIIYHNPITKEMFSGANFRCDTGEQNDIYTNSIELDEDDYIIAIRAKCDILTTYIAFLQFETSKGKILEGGLQSGEINFSIKAKQDHYFSDFGATLGDYKCNDVYGGLLMAMYFEEIPLIRVEEKMNEIRNYKNFRTIFKLLSEYLTFKENIQILMLNSHFYSLRKDAFF